MEAKAFSLIDVSSLASLFSGRKDFRIHYTIFCPKLQDVFSFFFVCQAGDRLWLCRSSFNQPAMHDVAVVLPDVGTG